MKTKQRAAKKNPQTQEANNGKQNWKEMTCKPNKEDTNRGMGLFVEHWMLSLYTNWRGNCYKMTQ